MLKPSSPTLEQPLWSLVKLGMEVPQSGQDIDPMLLFFRQTGSQITVVMLSTKLGALGVIVTR